MEIKEIKRIREKYNYDSIIILGFNEENITVTTHGETTKDSKQVSDFGNEIKRNLKFPESLCQSKPLKRKCGNCDYHKVDYGMYTFTGWGGDGSKGYCYLNPDIIDRGTDERACRFFEPNC